VYTYHEMKIIVDGESSYETGNKVYAVKGGVFYCKFCVPKKEMKEALG
jgi:hypothetical protein